MANVCATRAGARSGSARTTTSRSTSGRWARRKKNWPLGRATTASTASSAARPTTGIPTWPRTTTTSTSRTCPRTATTCRRTSPTRRSSSSATPSSPSRTSPGTSGSAPAPTTPRTTRPQEYIDKYKGEFDDGYEAYREWVLPRMIEKGILPEGTELTPINPMTEGTFSEADIVRPWDTLNDDEKTIFCRMAEVYAGFSEYTDAQVGRIVDYLEESGQLDNTLDLLLRRQRRLRRRQPERLGQRGQVLRRLPRRPRGEPGDDRQARRARHLQPLPDRLGGGVLHAVPDVQALLVPGRRLRPAGHPLAGGHQGRGRGARTSTTTATDIVPTILECCGVEMPDVVNGCEQTPLPGVSMRYTFDDADAPTRKETQYYEMLGTRGIWHDGWKAVTEHGPMIGIGQLRRGPLAALPHRRGPLRGARPRRPAPGEGRGAEGALARGGQGEQRAAAQRPAVIGNETSRLRRDGVPRAGPAERPVHLLPGHAARSRSARPPTPTACRTRSSPRSSSRPAPRA